jgi:HEAT repeat protein
MKKMNKVIALMSLFCFLVPVHASDDVTGITNTLLALLSKQDQTKMTAEDYESTSMRQLITLGTPAGYRIKLRYLEFGISLVEALKVARDPELNRRLIEQVQWSRRPRVRAEAIITLASLYDPAHKKYLKQALLDGKVGIRFAAVEALQIWGQPEAMTLLKTSMTRDWSPLMQISAAQAVISQGDPSGLPILFKGLDSESWVVRAMAARYLGDYAAPDDYQKLLIYLKKESKNDFVIAELAISALKLISRKGEKVSYSPFMPGWKDNEEVAYALGRGNVVELEPLIIVPPRARIPLSLKIASEINNELLNLIKNRLGKPLDPIQAADPVLQDLNEMVTPTGFALKTRYSELNYLLVEGLAGTQDPLLKMELENLARGSNPLVRATALVALAYNRDPSLITLLQDGLADPNALVRFGAMEAIEVGRFDSLLPAVIPLANQDPVPALKIYAMQVMAKFGQASARQMMLSHISDTDWPARAMTYWFLGRFGTSDDYSLMLSRLPVEQNPFVQAEIALAALRLQPLDDK